MSSNFFKLQLKKMHPYYYQIMGEMRQVRRSKCYFIVFMLKNLFVEKVKYDDGIDFTKSMLPHLSTFYKNHYCLLIASQLLK